MSNLKARDALEWNRLFRAAGVDAVTSARWAPVFEHEMARRDLSKGEQDLADFLPTVIVESAFLKRMKEGGNYRAARIREMGMASPPGSRWRSLVPRADELAGNERKFFEACYGGRMGNGPEGSGDGALYCGRGLIMLTGKDGYRWQGERSGQDLLTLPELAEQPHFALGFALDWWEGKVPDSALGDTRKVRKAVNGGSFGLDEVALVKAKLARAGL